MVSVFPIKTSLLYLSTSSHSPSFSLSPSPPSLSLLFFLFPILLLTFAAKVLLNISDKSPNLFQISQCTQMWTLLLSHLNLLRLSFPVRGDLLSIDWKELLVVMIMVCNCLKIRCKRPIQIIESESYDDYVDRIRKMGKSICYFIQENLLSFRSRR